MAYNQYGDYGERKDLCQISYRDRWRPNYAYNVARFSLNPRGSIYLAAYHRMMIYRSTSIGLRAMEWRAVRRIGNDHA